MRVALVHYWLVGMRGGEKVLEALCELFPKADLFTHVVDPEKLSPQLRDRTIKTTFVARLPRARTMYKSYLPLMPLALEQLDLQSYDLVISSESGPAKGIIPSPHALHICYCHSPMRYIWNMYHEYRGSTGSLKRFGMPWLAHYLRIWDESSASRVDNFIANSRCVADRIEKYYRRESQIIHPPVDVDEFEPVEQKAIGDYYLMVGELVRYKRPELAIGAFKKLRRRLLVIGGGEMLSEITAMADSNVTVLGPQPFEVLKYHYARARGLVFPGEEDFGIVPVEAMASGRPVIAYGRGGGIETVVDGVTGIHFYEQTVEALAEAVEECERTVFNSSTIVSHARRFSKQRFKSEMSAAIEAALAARVMQSSISKSRSANMPPYPENRIESVA
ncbi:glycosyltransferase [Microvirga arabica]|uniref:glycosyltransferase n=1 Tax=Microvirga arabica TaxID=1128671 RepID=UPI001939AD72|nr:glycosyltransferase [Microvirga arabica]MBM1175447.1 glycosyltransferase [Microvirga arabica]